MTSAVAAESGAHLFTAGKEGHIIKWDLHTGRRVTTLFKARPPPDPEAAKNKGKAKGKGKAPDESVPGHTDEVLGLALSGDGTLLASAGRDRRLCIWDVERGAFVRTFAGHLGHKDAIAVRAARLIQILIADVVGRASHSARAPRSCTLRLSTAR